MNFTDAELKVLDNLLVNELADTHERDPRKDTLYSAWDAIRREIANRKDRTDRVERT